MITKLLTILSNISQSMEVYIVLLPRTAFRIQREPFFPFHPIIKTPDSFNLISSYMQMSENSYYINISISLNLWEDSPAACNICIFVIKILRLIFNSPLHIGLWSPWLVTVGVNSPPRCLHRWIVARRISRSNKKKTSPNRTKKGLVNELIRRLFFSFISLMGF